MIWHSTPRAACSVRTIWTRSSTIARPVDLDSVYGRGRDDQLYLYLNSKRFLVGRELSGSALDKALTAPDVPRSGAPTIDPAARARAIMAIRAMTRT